MELGKNMQNTTIAESSEPMNRLAESATRLLAGEVGGVPVAIIACGVAAAMLGGLVAITAGG